MFKPLFNKSIFNNKDGWQAVSGVFQKSQGIGFDVASGSTFDDIGAFYEYINLLEQGYDKQNAFNNSMLKATPAAQKYAQEVDQFTKDDEELISRLRTQNYEFQAQNHSLSSVRKILNEYNSGMQDSGLSQEDFVKAIGEGNSVLGGYLGKVEQGKASMLGYAGAAIKANAGQMLLNAGMSLLNGAVSAGLFAALSLAAKGLDAMIVTAEEMSEKMATAFSEYDIAKEKVAETSKELETANARINELNSKKGLSLVEASELNNLKETVRLLEVQLDIEKERAAIKAKTAATSAFDAYNNNYKYDISAERTNEILTKGKEYQSPQGSTSKTDVSNTIAQIKGLKELRDSIDTTTEAGQEKWADYTEMIRVNTESVWEQEEILRGYKENLESIPIEQLGVGAKETLDEVTSALNYIYSEMAPDKVAQWKMDDLFDSDIMSNAKQKLVDIAKEAGNLNLVEKKLGKGGEFEFIKKSIESAGVAYEEFLGIIASEAGIIDFSAVRDNIHKNFVSAFSDGSSIFAAESGQFQSWLNNLSEEDMKLVYQISLDADTAKFTLNDWINTLEYYKANYSDLGITIAGEQDTASRVAAVRAEAFSPTGLSSESISAVESVFGDMEGYDYDEMFVNTATGVQLNEKAFKRLQKQYEKTKRAKIDDHIKDLRKQLDEATKAANEAEGAEKSRLQANADAISSQLRNAEELQAMYSGLTSAYNEYLQALETPNASDQFDTLAEGFEKAKEAIMAGRIGDDDFLSYVKLFTGKDYDFTVNGGTPQDAARDFEALNNAIAGSSVSWVDIMQGGQKGAENFVKMLSEVNSEWVKLNEATGQLELNFDSADVANQLGVTQDLIDLATQNLGTYGFNINADDMLHDPEILDEYMDRMKASIEQVNTAMKNATASAKESNETLKQLGATETTFNFESTNIENVKSEIEEARALLGQFHHGDGVIDLTLTGAQEAQDVLLTLIKRKQELTAADISFMSIDTSKLTGDVQTAVNALQTAKDLFDKREIAVAINADTGGIDAAIQSTLSALNSLPDETKANLGLNDSEYTSAVANLQDPEVSVQVKMDALDTVQQKITEIQSQSLINIGVNPELIAGTPEQLENAKQHVDRDYDPAETKLENATQHVTRSYDSVPTTVPGATQYITRVYRDGSGADAQGTAHASGTAFARGNWGTKESGVALMGELGPELLIDSKSGTWNLVGQDSAEFVKYNENSIIFNPEQTAQIFKYGKIRNGAKRGKAYANGTIGGRSFALWSGGGSFYKPTSSWLTGGGSGSGSGSSSNSSSNKSSSSSDKEETFEKVDWIEIAIDRIERIIENFARTAESTFKTLGKRLIATSDQIESIKDEIYTQELAANRYLKEASNAGLDYDTELKIQNGTIDINEYNEEQREKISDYQEWYEKYLESLDAQEELAESLGEAYESQFDAIQTDYENRLEAMENKADRYESKMDELEESGYLATTKYYKEMQAVEHERIGLMQTELVHLQKALDEAVNSGAIEKYSESWYEMSNSIDEVRAEIDDARVSLAEYEKTMREIEWDNFDYALDRISKMTDEVNFLIDLLDDGKMFSDDGKITSDGLAVMGLHGQNYNIYMEQSKQYAEEYAKVQEQLAKDPYNTDVIKRREELLELQQDSILAAEQEKQAIVDLVREGIDAEIESMDKLVTKYKDSLSAAKDLKDYQDRISESTEDIAELEKRIMAARGDTSDEGVANLQKLTKELADARKNLADTEYDKSVSDQEKMLDELMVQYEEVVNSRLDNVDALISEMIDTVNNNSSAINDTLLQATKDVGYVMSESVRTAWQESTYGINNILSTYTSDYNAQTTTINHRLDEILKNVAIMAQASNDSADVNISGIKKYASGGLVRYTGLAQVDGTPGKPESFLDAKATEQLRKFMEELEQMSQQSINISSAADIGNIGMISQVNAMNLADVAKGIISTPVSQDHSVNFGDINIGIEKVEDYNDFVRQLQKDPKFQQMIEGMTVDKMTGKSKLSKYKSTW